MDGTSKKEMVTIDYSTYVKDKYIEITFCFRCVHSKHLKHVQIALKKISTIVGTSLFSFSISSVAKPNIALVAKDTYLLSLRNFNDTCQTIHSSSSFSTLFQLFPQNSLYTLSYLITPSASVTTKLRNQNQYSHNHS